MNNQTETVQDELNYQNSVTEALPAVIDQATAVMDGAIQRLQSCDATLGANENRLELSRSSTNPRHPYATEHFTMFRDAETGKVASISITEEEIIDEPENSIYIVYGQSRFEFNTVDDVSHVTAVTNTKSYAVGGKDGPQTAERTDASEDLEQVQALLGSVDGRIDSTINRHQRRLAANAEAVAGKNSKAKRAGTKLLGLITGRR